LTQDSREPLLLFAASDWRGCVRRCGVVPHPEDRAAGQRRLLLDSRLRGNDGRAAAVVDSRVRGNDAGAGSRAHARPSADRRGAGRPGGLKQAARRGSVCLRHGRVDADRREACEPTRSVPAGAMEGGPHHRRGRVIRRPARLDPQSSFTGDLRTRGCQAAPCMLVQSWNKSCYNKGVA